MKLKDLFEDRHRAVLVLNTYDDSLVYCNRFGPTEESGNPPGQAVIDFVALGWPTDGVAIAAMGDQPSEPVAQVLEDGDVLVVSLVPSPEVIGGRVIATDHEAPVERAVAEHLVIRERAAIALEFTRLKALHTAGMAAFRESERLMDWCATRLIEAGRRPINPDGSIEATLL